MTQHPVSAKSDVGRRLKAMRQARGLSRKTVAGRIRMGQDRLANFENGRIRPDYGDVEAYCLAIGAHVSIQFDEDLVWPPEDDLFEPTYSDVVVGE